MEKMDTMDRSASQACGCKGKRNGSPKRSFKTEDRRSHMHERSACIM